MTAGSVKSRAAAVLAAYTAAAEAPRGAWDAHASVGALADGSGWWWSLHYRTGHGNTAAWSSSVERWDCEAFLLKIIEQLESDENR